MILKRRDKVSNSETDDFIDHVSNNVLDFGLDDSIIACLHGRKEILVSA
jgi:hypothetical protein